jgi:hypothetical protein
MRIINIKDSSELIRKARYLYFVIAFVFLFGCVSEAGLKQAQEYTSQSEAYYQKAISEYKELIFKGEDLGRLHFELGKLYYSHGNFKEAVEEFKKSNDPAAKKFLAVSLYKTADFTDALEIFNKQESGDEEYLYYKGLTCEKLNLFDQALETYRKIKNKDFTQKALERIGFIEKQANIRTIKEIDPQIYKILSGAPEAQRYPQAGALILSCDEKVEVNANGTQISYLHYLIKILNERGKEDFSEAHIDYDSTYEKVELEYARTIKPDGRVVDVGTRHIRDVSRYLNFPIYSNARVFIISFPEISEGAVIEYKVKVFDNELINKKDFVIDYPVQSSDPIVSADFSVTLPKERVLHIKNINEKYNNFGAILNPIKEEKDGKAIYRWQFKNLPQIIPESNMPSNVEVNPSIRVSTFDSWLDIYNWWWKLAKEKIKADSAIQDKVKELIRDKKSAQDKIRSIYNFCAKEIRYVAIEYGDAGFEPHKAEDTFKNKYGDCKDKAILLITMLKEAGFSAWPVLISTKDYYNLNEDHPTVAFNHAIAAMPFEGKTVFMDSTAETCSFDDLPEDDQERKVLIFKEDGFLIENTPLYPAEHNLARQDLRIKVNRDETMQAQKSIFTLGFYGQAQRYWLLYTQPELIQETLKEKIQETSIGSKLDNYAIENLNNLNQPVVLKYSFRGPEYFTAAGKLRIMPQLTSLDTALVAKDKRRYPIDLGALDTRESDLEIEIPDNFSVKYLPETVAEESPWLKFSAEYSNRDNKIYFKQIMQMKKSAISENEYPDFKIFFEGLAKKIKQRIVLERIN